VGKRFRKLVGLLPHSVRYSKTWAHRHEPRLNNCGGLPVTQLVFLHSHGYQQSGDYLFGLDSCVQALKNKLSKQRTRVGLLLDCSCFYTFLGLAKIFLNLKKL
jgi:hypothetical protein